MWTTELGVAGSDVEVAVGDTRNQGLGHKSAQRVGAYIQNPAAQAHVDESQRHTTAHVGIQGSDAHVRETGELPQHVWYGAAELVWAQVQTPVSRIVQGTST